MALVDSDVVMRLINVRFEMKKKTHYLQDEYGRMYFLHGVHRRAADWVLWRCSVCAQTINDI